MNKENKKLLERSLFANNLIAAALIFTYCIVYGITAHIVLTGLQLLFFMSSFLFGLTVLYHRDPEVQKQKAKKGIVLNQALGTVLLLTYLLVYGISSFAIMSGFNLVFFMLSYLFVMSIAYLRDVERLEDEGRFKFVSRLYDGSIKLEKKDVTNLIAEMNDSLTTIMGFSELLLRRKMKESEREFMTMIVFNQAISMSDELKEAANLLNDSETDPAYYEIR